MNLIIIKKAMDKEIIEYKDNINKDKYSLSNKNLNKLIILLIIIILIVFIGVCVIVYYLSRINKVVCQAQCDSTFRSISNIHMFYNITNVNNDYLYHLYENCLKNCDNCDNLQGYNSFFNEKYCI